MRGSFGLLKKANGIGSTAKLASSCALSTCSSSGGGGGRGGGASAPPKFSFVSSHPGDDDSGSTGNLPGRGRGKPLASTPYSPSFVASNQPSEQQQGIGRGESLNDQDSAPKRPIFSVVPLIQLPICEYPLIN